MSAGYSGNIMNYEIPKNWAFNQFATVTVSGIGIDKDGYSGRDVGFNEIGVKLEILNEYNKIFNTEIGINVFREPIVICDTPAFEIEVSATVASDPKNTNNEIVISRNGELSYSRTEGPVMFNVDLANTNLKELSAQDLMQTISIEIYKNGNNSIYFTVVSIDPFTVKYDVYLERNNLKSENIQVDFTTTITLSEYDENKPKNLPNPELVCYFTGINTALVTSDPTENGESINIKGSLNGLKAFLENLVNEEEEEEAPEIEGLLSALANIV
ncbi:MAG: hypothetical protein ACRDDY_00740, partial [Clostridium sp.]|uniref:hypothetical protein n=1 Tax=Clostridium sp. TaxID=1506 RepID=UPI003EE6FEF8